MTIVLVIALVVLLAVLVVGGAWGMKPLIG